MAWNLRPLQTVLATQCRNSYGFRDLYGYSGTSRGCFGFDQCDCTPTQKFTWFCELYRHHGQNALKIQTRPPQARSHRYLWISSGFCKLCRHDCTAREDCTDSAGIQADSATPRHQTASILSKLPQNLHPQCQGTSAESIREQEARIPRGSQRKRAKISATVARQTLPIHLLNIFYAQHNNRASASRYLSRENILCATKLRM